MTAIGLRKSETHAIVPSAALSDSAHCLRFRIGEARPAIASKSSSGVNVRCTSIKRRPVMMEKPFGVIRFAEAREEFLPALYRIGLHFVDAAPPLAYFAFMEGGWIVSLGIVAGTVAAMEVLAAFVHRRVMHGWGWGWHRSHHEPRRGPFETNDLYALVFAGLSLLLFTFLTRLWPPFWWVGAGTIVYGLLYGLLHDGLVHRRFGFGASPRKGYLRRLVQAHRLHHAVKGRDGAVSFGFLYAPPARLLRRRLRELETP